jgi:hypothetical protein
LENEEMLRKLAEERDGPAVPQMPLVDVDKVR